MTRLASLALLCALLAGCTSQPATAPRFTAAPQQRGVDISDTGTWAKSLNATDCSDFLTKMTGPEQFQVSRVLLHLSRMGTLPDPPVFPDTLVQQFQQDMADGCAENGAAYPIVAQATLAYLGDTASYEPAYR